jgi:hypothetical protein
VAAAHYVAGDTLQVVRKRVPDLKLNASILISSWQVLCRQLLFSFGFDTQKKIFNGLFSSRQNERQKKIII